MSETDMHDSLEGKSTSFPNRSKRFFLSRTGAIIIVLILIAAALMVAFLPSQSESPRIVDEDEGREPWRAFSVVAPVDTGINPYHEHFQMNESYPGWLLEMFNVTFTCDLSQTGSLEERIEADRASIWERIETGDVVYFNNTRIIGTSATSRDVADAAEEHLILDEGGHGTAVTGAVLDANPEAIIFFVETDFSDDNSREAVLMAADQPLVDVITTSFGPIFSLPVPGIESETKYAVLEQGKLHAGASDNSRSPALQDPTAGPPWSIGVSGYQEDGSGGKEASSGTFADVLSDWTQDLPSYDTLDEYHTTSGTSFATPRTAGILSRAIQDIRAAVGDDIAGATIEGRAGDLIVGMTENGDNFTLKNWHVRDAMNLSGWYPDCLSWDPSSFENRGTPINCAAPWLQAGWGILDLETSGLITGHLLGTSTLPAKPARAVTHMENRMDLRLDYWADA